MSIEINLEYLDIEIITIQKNLEQANTDESKKVFTVVLGLARMKTLEDYRNLKQSYSTEIRKKARILAQSQFPNVHCKFRILGGLAYDSKNLNTVISYLNKCYSHKFQN
jgi:hypothetical protein